MLVLHDPNTLLHETVELLGAKIRPALESPDRIRAIVQSVEESKHELLTVKLSNEEIEQVLELARHNHDQGYLQHLASVHSDWLSAHLIEADGSVLPECFRFTHAAQSRAGPQPPKDRYARAGYYAFDLSSGIMRDTWASTLASANLAVSAVKAVVTPPPPPPPPTDGHPQSTTKSVVALCRPPGHHCDGQHAGGYCYINNAALAVSAYRAARADGTPARVAILDLDFHHGNGTQEIFYDDAAVLYVSIHGADEFPYYTGGVDEAGGPSPAAHGLTVNLPLRTGSSFRQYADLLTRARDAVARHQPDLLIVSLGFDTFRLDPLGSFQIDTADYATMARVVREKVPDVPAVILLEGGYVVEQLGANLLSFLDGWGG